MQTTKSEADVWLRSALVCVGLADLSQIKAELSGELAFMVRVLAGMAMRSPAE